MHDGFKELLKQNEGTFAAAAISSTLLLVNMTANPSRLGPCSCMLPESQTPLTVTNYILQISLDAVIVGFVFYKCGRGEIQDPLEGVPDPSRDGGVQGGPVPDAEDVLLEPDADHCPAHLLPHHELLAQHRQHQVLPTPGRQAFKITLSCLLNKPDLFNAGYPF